MHFRFLVGDISDKEAVFSLLRLLSAQPVEKWPGIFYQTEREICLCADTGSPHHRKWFGKLFSRRGLSGIIPGLFCGSKALRAYKVSDELHRRGYPTPRPIGIASFTSGPNRGRVLLLTCWVEGILPFGPFFDEFVLHRHEPNWVQRKRKLIRLVALLLRDLHHGGIYHGDLTMNNIVIRPHLTSFELFIIDTADIRSTRFISQRRKEKNLTEVNRFVLDMSHVSKTDRLRFLQVYMDDFATKSNVIRNLWRRTNTQSQRELNRQGRSFYYGHNITSSRVSLTEQQKGHE